VNGPMADPVYKYLKSKQPVSQPALPGPRMDGGELGKIEWYVFLAPQAVRSPGGSRAEPVCMSRAPSPRKPFLDALVARACRRNYTKFLIDRQGNAVKRFNPAFDPRNFENDVRNWAS
jgi:glutathione peroxidase-family protein